MSKYLFFVVITLASIFFISSCSKDDNESTDGGPIASADYYVKYVISGGMYYINSFSVNTDKGSINFPDGVKNKSWTQTYGPVKRGFAAKVTASTVNPTVEIYVCKEQAPFVLKASESRNNTATASYTIDF